MDALVNLIPLPPDLGWYFAIDMVIAILLLSAMWWISAVLLSGPTDKELTKKDNFALE